ncbi:uncharacterized protein LOC122262749 [Penaeus japonicus]|uniref:uncharacterized protein LOC122262749 n=1 Tax=Penaeus japonicus TaxID=27405 RepID=UPI001C711A2B|nr:uncharacterized protein LOC122262749 [Penaeus japonicus]
MIYFKIDLREGVTCPKGVGKGEEINKRLTLTHYMYFILTVWILVLIHRHFRHPAVASIASGSGGGDRKVTHLALPTPQKVVAAEAYRALKEVRDNMLKEFIGVNLPPWLDDSVNKTQSSRRPADAEALEKVMPDSPASAHIKYHKMPGLWKTHPGS